MNQIKSYSLKLRPHHNQKAYIHVSFSYFKQCFFLFFINTIFFAGEESAVEALIKQFYHWEGCAKIAENRTNAILDGEKDTENQKTQYKSNEEFIEETVAKCKIFFILLDLFDSKFF